MRINYRKELVGLPVVIDRESRPLTTVKDLIIEPATGKIAAFLVDLSKHLIILPIDVIRWKGPLEINGHDAIVEAEEIVRLAELLNKDVKICGQAVETRDGEYLGKVQDFEIDTNVMQITKLYVYKDLIGLIRYDGVIISAKDIVEILPSKIVVRNREEVVKEEEVVLEEAMTV